MYLCKNCKHYLGLSDGKTNYLCWRKKRYTDFIGFNKNGEICRDVNIDGKCKDYKFSLIKYLTNRC